MAALLPILCRFRKQDLGSPFRQPSKKTSTLPSPFSSIVRRQPAGAHQPVKLLRTLTRAATAEDALCDRLKGGQDEALQGSPWHGAWRTGWLADGACPRAARPTAQTAAGPRPGPRPGPGKEAGQPPQPTIWVWGRLDRGRMESVTLPLLSPLQQLLQLATLAVLMAPGETDLAFLAVRSGWGWGPRPEEPSWFRAARAAWTRGASSDALSWPCGLPRRWLPRLARLSQRSGVAFTSSA